MTRIALLLMVLLLPLHGKAEVLRFYAESLPPYHYIDEQNRPAGLLVEIIEALCKEARVIPDFRMLPFARGYQTLLTQPGVFMFSLIRTPGRETKFQWVGKVYRNDAWLVGLKDRAELHVNKMDEAKHHVIGTIRGYHSESYLKAAGFVENKNLFLSVNYELMWNMLYRRRTDYVLTNSVSMDIELTSLGLDKSAIEKYYHVTNFPVDLYIVTHLATKQPKVQRIADGLKRIKSNGTYQKIIDRWGL